MKNVQIKLECFSLSKPDQESVTLKKSNYNRWRKP